MSRHSHSTTNYHDHVPIHRLNSPQTLLWLFGGEPQRRMASNLAKRYPCGVGVCAATLRLIAFVDPKGNARHLPPPHKLYEMHQISNQPLVTECQCADFFDPEIGGPWRMRGTEDHHPLCQFERVAGTVYKHMMQISPGRVVVGIDRNQNPIFSEKSSGQVRPDEALRARVTLR